MTADTLRRSHPLIAEYERQKRRMAEHVTAVERGDLAFDADRPATKEGNADATVPFGGGDLGRWPTAVFDHVRMEAAGCLTAGVAHGFNNVLQALLGGLDLAIDEVEPRVRKDLEIAMHVGQQGMRLIDHLRSFSRQQVLRPAALDLAPLLGGLSRTLGRTLGRDVWVHAEVPPALPPVLADAAHLDAALLNLALNARDAMPGGGELRIEARAEGDRVVVAMSDNGQGMPPEVMARACEPFFTTKDAVGSGLGLSMVYGFAYQSGGGLRIRSAQGQGTRVELLLPVAPLSAAATSRPTRGQVNGRVLVVDDQPEVRRITAAFLRKEGFEVIEADSGGDVLDGVMFLGPSLDAFVTDYAMPGMDGVELVLRIREEFPALPALVTTGCVGPRGYGSGSGVMMGLEHLPTDVEVLHKPFQREDLALKLKGLIEGAGRTPPCK